jgi:glutamyl endopeptidase
MSKTTTYETKRPTEAKAASPAREGKMYAYQRPPESAPAPSNIVEQKQKLFSAFDDFIDALAKQGPGTTPNTGSGTTDGGGNGTPSTAGNGTPSGAGAATTGAAGGGTSGASGPAGTGTGGKTGTAGAGGGAASSGATNGSGYSGTGAAGTGTGMKPSTGYGGERPAPTEAQKVAAEKEALEVSTATQRSAYQLDRVRESSRKVRAQEDAAKNGSGAGPQILTMLSKHTSDSNRAPLTEALQWNSSFGSLGKALAPTIEKASVSAKRPETVPAAATVSGPKPIDAYYGSFGSAIERAAARAKVEYSALEAIIGNDDRVRVTNNQVYPWRCVCSLLMTANTGAQYLGTGWLVGPRIVLTAGHCVFMADEGGWVTQIEVIPGRNGVDRPYGSAVSREFRSVSGWTQDNDSDYDYGAILLPADARFGEQLGWFGYASRGDDYLRGVTLNLSGYPGDGGKAGSQVDGTQWYASRGVRDVLDKQITYEIDTFGGQSGAPVWELGSDGSRYGVAIHTFGTPVNNGGTRITGDVFDNIVLWAGQAP